MEVYLCARYISLYFAAITIVQSNDGIVSVINRLDDLNNEIIMVKMDIARAEERTLHQIQSAMVSVQEDLKQHISELVREALTGIIQGESVEKMLRSQVLSEVRQLRRESHIMKKQYYRLMTFNTAIQEELNTYKDGLKKAGIYGKELNLCSKYVADSDTLKMDLAQCKTTIHVCNQILTQKDKAIQEMKHTVKRMKATCRLQLREDVSTDSTLNAMSETKSTSAVTATTVTTSIPVEETDSRIIIVPYWSPTRLQFRQLHVHKNTISTYQLHSLKRVASVAFVLKLRRLLIGLYFPPRIISTVLDSDETTVVYEGVETYGMAVDEEREIVFMTTYHPRYTISRMTTHGRHFHVVSDMSRESHWPRTIAVDSTERKIYTCNMKRLFMLSYDGGGFEIIATGSRMYALTLDNTGTILYFNDAYKIMKLTLSQNVSSVVAELTVIPWNILYYMDRVYFSSTGSMNCTVGAVNIHYNTVNTILQYLFMDGATRFGICLVP